MLLPPPPHLNRVEVGLDDAPARRRFLHLRCSRGAVAAAARVRAQPPHHLTASPLQLPPPRIAAHIPYPTPFPQPPRTHLCDEARPAAALRCRPDCADEVAGCGAGLGGHRHGAERHLLPAAVAAGTAQYSGVSGKAGSVGSGSASDAAKRRQLSDTPLPATKPACQYHIQRSTTTPHLQRSTSTALCHTISSRMLRGWFSASRSSAQSRAACSVQSGEGRGTTAVGVSTASERTRWHSLAARRMPPPCPHWSLPNTRAVPWVCSRQAGRHAVEGTSTSPPPLPPRPHLAA